MADPLDEAIASLKAKAAPKAQAGVDPLDAAIAAKRKAPSMLRTPQVKPDDVSEGDLLVPRPSAVQRASQGVVAPGDEEGVTPTQLAASQAATRANSPEAQDPQAQAVIGGMLGAGAGAAVGNTIRAASAPALARLIGGGVAGAVPAATSGGTLKDALKGAALGALMSAPAASGERLAANEAGAARKVMMPFARAGNETEQRALLDAGEENVAHVLEKYKIGSIKDPIIAQDATSEGIIRAGTEVASAERALQTAKTMNNQELVKEATLQKQQALRELHALRALAPITERAATAQAMKESLTGKLTTKPIETVKNGVERAAALPFKAGVGAAQAAMKPVDAIMAKLIQARASGTLTPQMLTAAAAAGVSPQILQKLAPQSAYQLPPSPFKQ